jgi:transposase
MNPRTIAIDLAKDVFEIAIANAQWRITERHRLSRKQFITFMAQQPVSAVVMEACGTAHFWARRFRDQGHAVQLLPAQYVRPYRRRNKTDRADSEALIEAARCEGIIPIPIKSVEQQQLQHLHRLREQWKATRVARINGLRGILREQGINLPTGAAAALKRAPTMVDQEAFPAALRLTLHAVLDEIAALEFRIKAVERQLLELTREDDAVRRLRQVPGIGLLTSTAMVAAAGSPNHFKSGRHLAAWLGITPRESSSGHRRQLGRITKRGDVYLRMLIIHGARSVLARAKTLARSGTQSLSRLHRWALKLEQRIGHNKATVALANKLARIAWAMWRYDRDFDGNFADTPVAA